MSDKMIYSVLLQVHKHTGLQWSSADTFPAHVWKDTPGIFGIDFCLRPSAFMGPVYLA